ncbi:YabP/YqfC family sporulation protein [Alicyclobacillus sp. ALC3]|uniref:YabP/YqfC family sporulation protein n=1 Tax=Alicyclobacillus sp. ALC3 TaxID=2796143 RepID=UPI0023786ED5|nr:YabP/YqfC family sporulation protein [Alicyclobacillus sp. ALC3]WDL96338.1 hypothetical protein JC200_18720 [Alicyclobacillus sp. ALC3]
MRTFGSRFKQAATEWFALPPDTLLDVSRLTCLNANELTLYNVESLMNVSDTELVADLGLHAVHVEGTGFTVTLVAAKEVHLKGDITRITYDKHGGPRP